MYTVLDCIVDISSVSQELCHVSQSVYTCQPITTNLSQTSQLPAGSWLKEKSSLYCYNIVVMI